MKFGKMVKSLCAPAHFYLVVSVVVVALLVVQNLLNGDLNNDNTLNVLDVVLMVNIILDDSTYLPDADLNLDGAINVLDVINLINLILDR